MVVNVTNGDLIAAIAGSEDSDDWYGTKIECYNDETICFGGRQVGGIRVRRPPQAQSDGSHNKPAGGTSSVVNQDFNDDIRF